MTSRRRRKIFAHEWGLILLPHPPQYLSFVPRKDARAELIGGWKPTPPRPRHKRGLAGRNYTVLAQGGRDVFVGSELLAAPLALFIEQGLPVVENHFEPSARIHLGTGVAA